MPIGLYEGIANQTTGETLADLGVSVTAAAVLLKPGLGIILNSLWFCNRLSKAIYINTCLI
jgi:hypothetical protein